MEPISWTNGVKDEVLERTKKVRKFYLQKRKEG